MREKLDSQLIEILGRNKLIEQLLLADLEVALPVRDRGVDLIAYSDIDLKTGIFKARPIQLKASSNQSFSIDRKYRKFSDLLITYVWHLIVDLPSVVYALNYDEALEVADIMGYTKTESWKRGLYVSTKPSVKLQKLLTRFEMTPSRWRERVTKGI